MNRIICVFFLSFTLLPSCTNQTDYAVIDPVNWDNRTIDFELADSLHHGTSYLSVYSQIYSQTEHKRHNLTATVSLRNTNRTDTIYINKAEYFNTKGNTSRMYFKKAIYICPMETVEIVIDEHDNEGGTGANFLFDWTVKHNSNEPIFDAVMISTSGNQGISFTTQGKKLN